MLHIVWPTGEGGGKGWGGGAGWGEKAENCTWATTIQIMFIKKKKNISAYRSVVMSTMPSEKYNLQSNIVTLFL